VPEVDALNKTERQLFDGFTFVLGILLGGIAAAGLGLSARLMSASEPSAHMTDEADEGEINLASQTMPSPLEPIGHVALIGDPELAEAAAAAAAAPTQVDTELSGPQVFNEACYLCHAPPGVPGAPVVGDVAAWENRVTQGIEVLQEHALNGYQGEAGFMPAKGGRVDLSDAEVRSAVEYMIEQLP
jgi:cytochrome c